MVAKEVQAIGKGGAEGQDDARHRGSTAVINLQAVAPDIRIGEKIGHTALYQLPTG